METGNSNCRQTGILIVADQPTLLALLSLLLELSQEISFSNMVTVLNLEEKLGTLI
jgi:hypothetical protein